MYFESPEWFVFLAVTALAGWYWRGLKLWKPSRVVFLILLTLLLAEPHVRRFADGLDLFVLVDRSASAQSTVAPRVEEWESIILKAKGNDDRLEFIDFGEGPVWRSRVGNALFEGGIGESNMALAIRSVLSGRDPNKLTKILLLSDGYFTDNLQEVEETLITDHISLEYRLPPSTGASDVRVSRLNIPERIQLNEPFIIEADIEGENGPVAYTLIKGNQIAQEGSVEVVNGRASLRFMDRGRQPGAQLYELRIHKEGDTIPGNNRQMAWVETSTGPRILLLTSFTNDPVATVLRDKGFQVVVETDMSKINIGSLSGVKAVIINDVPANILPQDFLPALDFFVRSQGGGFAMIGGKYSFGSGGYFNSPIDEVIPVSMELRQEHRKLAVAMAFVLDRSGSMSAGISGGKTKMDLANSGASASIALLGEMDSVTVYAVDSSAHTIVPLTQVGPNRAEIIDRTSRIVSMGGGIYVYTGLKAAWAELKKSQAGQKHIILFADAADAEEPGDYKKLLEEMVNEKATISVIGLGTPADPDAKFLEDIALRGNGRVFFNRDAATLPAIFTQETVTIARSAFIEELVGVTESAGWLQITNQPIRWMPSVDGYNLSYLREGATAAIFTNDDYAAPLVAYWQRGAGRSAAVTFPLSGSHSMLVRRWTGYGDFIQTLTRWLMGEDLPEGIGLRTELTGDQLAVNLYYSDEWENRITDNFPRIVMSTAGTDEARELVWERVSPGHFRATTRLEGGKPMRGAVSIGQHVLQLGPVMINAEEEWQTDPLKVTYLRSLAAKTGGGDRVNLADVWHVDPSQRYTSLQIYLLVTALLVLLLDIFSTRTGVSFWGWMRALTRK